MSKLSLDALKERAEAVASEDLLTSISGGTESDCHPCEQCVSNITTTQGAWQNGTYGWIHLLFH